MDEPARVGRATRPFPPGGPAMLRRLSLNLAVAVAVVAPMVVPADATVEGPITATTADTVQLLNTTVSGPVRLFGTTGDVTIVGSTVEAPVEIRDATTAREPVVAGTTVSGPLRCSGNDQAPVDLEAPNAVAGRATGQCGDLGA